MALQSKCSATDCNESAHKKGLCNKHYYRLYRHGSVEQTRPQDWGKREKHPLYGTWCSLRRYPTVQMCDEWKNDFWLFVKDVVERPSKDVFLKRRDKSKPLNKENAVWFSRQALYENTQNDGRSKYLRDFRKINPEWFKRDDAIRKYGVTRESLNQLIKNHGGLCAICKKPETQKKRNSQETMELAIDHCHETHKVRGLLCSSCNQGLGRFKDDIGLLESAIEYLKRHK